MTLYIFAAAERLERDIDRQLISATYEYSTETFGDFIKLPIGPVTTVTSITYLDTDGAQQTLAPSEYRFDPGSQRIYPASGTVFPCVDNDPLAVVVGYTAGYGDDEGCLPRLLRNAILLAVGKWFYDPAQEGSALHSQETAYQRIVTMLRPGAYP